jgi:dienelactone hydrolase
VSAALVKSSNPLAYIGDDETVKEMLYAPASTGKYSVVVVIHEWSGIK